MNKTINVTVKNKIATRTDDTVYVCGNSDFVIDFDFDDEWAEYDYKTARFIYGGSYQDIVFQGNTCPVPIISNVYKIYIGVFAGNLRTTTPAYIGAKKSILCEDGSPAAPSEDVYAQIMEMMQGTGEVDPEMIAAAVDAYMQENPVEATTTTETDPTVCSWAKRELFNKENLVDPANRNSFVTIDGVEYYRYHCSAQNFEYYNPVPKQGSVTITYREVDQYSTGVGTQLVVYYDDGSMARFELTSGKIATFTTDANKTFVKLTGNYDRENWALLDMSVMSMMASYDKDVPVETDPTLSVEGKAADAKAVGDALANFGGVAASIEPAEDDIPKVFLTGDAFSDMTTAKNEVEMELEYISKTERFAAGIKIKFQGASSLSFPKKNFTIKMYEDSTLETKLKKSFKDWGFKANKFVLKANYIDHTHARNIVSARLWDEIVKSRSNYADLPEEMRTSPKSGAIDGFPIKLYVNGTYQGLYTWNFGKDAWMWNMDEDNANHALLCCCYNDNGVLLEKAGNFRALWSGVNEDNWEIEVGTTGTALTTSLNALISCVKDTDDETFKATIGNYLDINSALDYYLYFWANAGLDSLENNLLLATYDGVKWYCGGYDMDAVWGLHYTGKSFIATDFVCPDDYQGPYSLLWERIVKLFVPELKARYAELRSSVLSFPNIVTHFERFMDVIGLDLLAEDLTVYSGIPSGSTNNIKQIRNYVRDRLAYVDAQIEALTENSEDEPSEEVPCTGISLSASELTFTEAGTQTLTATVEPDGCTDEVVWSSSDNDVASVSGGVVTAMANGIVTITATCGEYSASCSVSVSGIESGTDEDVTNILNGVAFSQLVLDTSGNELSSTADLTSDYFEVGDYVGKKLLLDLSPAADGAATNRIIFYNESKTFLSYASNTGGYTATNASFNPDVEPFAFIVPDECKYARVSLNNSHQVMETLELRLLEADIFDTATMEDYGYDYKVGTLTSNTNYAHISVDVQEGERFTGTYVDAVCFFDTDNNYLGGFTTAFGNRQAWTTWDIPSNCTSIGINHLIGERTGVEIYKVSDAARVGYHEFA